MKKKFMTGILMLLTLQLAAQQLPSFSDNILEGKPALLAKFIHFNPEPGKDTTPKSFTTMPADTFVYIINQFRTAANALISQDPDEKRRELKKGDLDYYIYNFRDLFINYHGFDRTPLKPGEKPRKLIPFTREERESLVTRTGNPDFSVNNVALYKVSAAYRLWINGYLESEGRRKFPVDPDKSYWFGQVSKLKAEKTEVSDPVMKENLMYNTTILILQAVKDSAAKEDSYQDFMRIAVNPAHRKSVEEMYTNYKTMLANPMAPDFNYKDASGKQVTLTSLRGKYVYLDFWATWCGPCKQQFPYLASLEEKFEGKMHFVGISIDKPEDEKKWEAYVKSAQLPGMQLLADKGPESDFIKRFNISGVPRAIIIDPQGKVVSGEAKPPSDPQLAAQLEALLKN